MNALTLFAGAGGADIGLQRAGFTHLACVEGDATACATLRAAGYPAVHAWIGGPGPDGQPAWQWDGTPVDLLWASPPCQPYSSAGKRLGAGDARDGWPATLATIAEVQPRWVIIENVGGAPVESWASDLGGLFSVFRYPCVSWATLDAADWGLPSHRVRRFLVAGPRGYRWPDPTHKGAQVGFGASLLPLPAEYAGRGRGASRPDLLGRPCAGVCTTEVKGTRASEASGYGFNGGPDRASDSLFLATGRRRLTWQECATLVGFPAGYPFQGTSEARYRQVGNAVAPVMAEALGQSIRDKKTGAA